jgi:hypothetical protein
MTEKHAQKPLFYIDINLNLFFKNISFEGEKKDPDFNYIYLDVCSRHLSSLDAFAKDIEFLTIRLSKKSFPFLHFQTKIMTGEKYGTLEQEIPVIVIPDARWDVFRIPRKLKFDVTSKLPKFEILKNYLSVYKKFKYINFCVRSNCINLSAGANRENRITTVFDKLKTMIYDEEENDLPLFKIDSYISVKDMIFFMHSVSKLQITKSNWTCSAVRNKCLKFKFADENKTIILNYIVFTTSEENEE